MPEIIQNVINKPFKMIEPTLDKTNNISFMDFCNETAHQLGIINNEKIDSAIKSGWTVFNNFQKMSLNEVPFKDAVKCAINNETISRPIEIVKPLSVVVVAHGYNLFDERISFNLLKKLEKMGVKAFTILKRF